MTLSTLTLLAGLLACGGGQTPPVQDGAEPEQPAPVPAPEAPKVDTKAVVDALAVSKPEPKCPDIEKMTPDPVATYRAILAEVKEPPIVVMRAATCMINHHPREAEVDALKWVTDPEAATLTTLVLGRLDTMPLESAKKIALAALKGPHKDLAKLRVARLRTPELKALAAEAN